MTAVVLAGVLVVLAGVAIGTTSVGGILVLPALTAVLGIDIVTAVAATSCAFLATGLLTLADLGRTAAARRTVRDDLPLHVAAFVGAAAGALAVHVVPAAGVQLWIAALAFVSGVHALVGALAASPRASKPWPRAAALVAIGLAVGTGSGLSGTAGPILLLPVLLLLGQDLSRSVAAALVLQIPIAVAATGAHLATGRLDVRLGLAIAAGLALGAWLGRRLAGRIDARRLKIVTGLVLVATGIGYALA